MNEPESSGECKYKNLNKKTKFIFNFNLSLKDHTECHWPQPDSSVNILKASFVTTLQFSAISSSVPTD